MTIKHLLGLAKLYTGDPIKYHPERCLIHHIGLVTARAHLIGDRSLVCAAILHDLCKPTHGVDHAKAMAQMIYDVDDIRYFIHTMGAKVDTVHGLVLHHMDKQVTKRNKCTPFIDRFFVIDDMICRYDQAKIFTPKYTLPDGTIIKGKTITHIGMSPVQAACQTGQFTITVDRTPLTFDLDHADYILKTLV
jgi:hypothetical protein